MLSTGWEGDSRHGGGGMMHNHHETHSFSKYARDMTLAGNTV